MKTHRLFALWCLGTILCMSMHGIAAESTSGDLKRREPFKSLIERSEIERELIYPDIDENALAPLQRIQDVKGQLKLIGIIQGKLGDYGVVHAPDGKTYMLTVGTLVGIFDGRVTSITDKTVVITETKTFRRGETLETETSATSLYLDPLEEPLEAAEVHAEETAPPATAEEHHADRQQSERRDPFKSLLERPEIAVEFIMPADEEEFLLQDVMNVGQLKAIGILQGELGERGVVYAPDGKTYMVTVGTRIGAFGGVVTAISENAIVITETKQLKTGNTIETQEVETVLKVRPLDEGL